MLLFFLYEWRGLSGIICMIFQWLLTFFSFDPRIFLHENIFSCRGFLMEKESRRVIRTQPSDRTSLLNVDRVFQIDLFDFSLSLSTISHASCADWYSRRRWFLFSSVSARLFGKHSHFDYLVFMVVWLVPVSGVLWKHVVDGYNQNFE